MRFLFSLFSPLSLISKYQVNFLFFNNVHSIKIFFTKILTHKIREIDTHNFSYSVSPFNLHQFSPQLQYNSWSCPHHVVFHSSCHSSCHLISIFIIVTTVYNLVNLVLCCFHSFSFQHFSIWTLLLNNMKYLWTKTNVVISV